jgi:hypothetical protein
VVVVVARLVVRLGQVVVGNVSLLQRAIAIAVTAADSATLVVVVVVVVEAVGAAVTGDVVVTVVVAVHLLISPSICIHIPRSHVLSFECLVS